VDITTKTQNTQLLYIMPLKCILFCWQHQPHFLLFLNSTFINYPTTGGWLQLLTVVWNRKSLAQDNKRHLVTSRYNDVFVCRLRECEAVQQYLHSCVTYTARLWERTTRRLVYHQKMQYCCDLCVIDWDEIPSLMETLGYECTQPVAITTTVKLPPINTIILAVFYFLKHVGIHTTNASDKLVSVECKWLQ